MKIYYIETTLNGYIIKKTPICDWERNIDYIDKLIFIRDDEEINYYEEITGDMDELDDFLRRGKRSENNKDDKSNVYMEHYLTDSVGYYIDRYIGLMIK